MEENNTPKKVDKKLNKLSKTVTVKLNLNFFYVASAIVILVVVFFLGSAWGSRDDKKSSSSNSASGSTINGRNQNRWTAVGTVEEIAADRIKVKDSRKDIKDAQITKETKIVNRKGEDKKASDIKKGARVIITGEKDGDKLKATRIRIQD